METAEIGSKESRHYIGGPCKHGNVAMRRVSDRKCICSDCSRELVAKRLAKRQAIAALLPPKPEKPPKVKVRTGRKRVPAEQKLASMRRARSAWSSRNLDKVLANYHKRRARKLNATPPWFGELDEFVMLEAGDLTRRRELATGIRWEVDHAIPLAAREACGLHCATICR